MLIESSQDIFLATEHTLLVPSNAAGVMGAGLAKQFKQRYYGSLFLEYRKLFPYQAHYSELLEKRARHLVALPLPDGHQGLIFCTKTHWRRPSDIALIEDNLSMLYERWHAMDIRSIAMPPVGCGLGGLDYIKDVRPLLVRYFENTDYTVHVVGIPQAVIQML